MDIDSKDCRLEGFGNAAGRRWYRAIHLTTGTIAEFPNGTTKKREAMDALQRAVDDIHGAGQAPPIA